MCKLSLVKVFLTKTSGQPFYIATNTFPNFSSTSEKEKWIPFISLHSSPIGSSLGWYFVTIHFESSVKNLFLKLLEKWIIKNLGNIHVQHLRSRSFQALFKDFAQVLGTMAITERTSVYNWGCGS